MRELWACRAPTGVRAVGGRVEARVPVALQEAVATSPAAAKQVLTKAAANDLPEATVNWASGGNILAAPEASVANFFRSLFAHIEAAGLAIEVDPQDLFHGHVFALPPGAAGGSGELGMLMHAKEYPEDLNEPKGIRSGFTTQSPGYADRNLLYLASTNRVYVIDPTEASKTNWCLLSNLEIEEWLPDWAKPWRVKTIDERAFVEMGAGSRLLDLNFLPQYLSKPTGPMVLFTKAFN